MFEYLHTLPSASGGTRTHDTPHVHINSSLTDKRFAVTARLSGVLPVTVGLLKRCYSDHNCLHSVLGVIKILAGNSYDTYNNYYTCLACVLNKHSRYIILYIII